MGTFNFEIFILQIILIIIFIIIIFQILRYNHTAHLEKRIGKYAIDPINNRYTSVFDKFSRRLRIIVKSIGNILYKSIVIRNYSKRYSKYIEYNDDINEVYKFRPIDYISIKIITIISWMGIAAISNIFRYKYFSFLQFILIFFVGFFSMDIFLFFQERSRKRQIDEDMLKAIIIMNSAFKSGRTTMQAIEIVKNELSGPIGEEFKKMYVDISFGLSLDVVFERFSKRIDNEDAKYITASLTILNKTGGDIVKVFSSIEKSFFARRKLKNEFKTLTASSNIMFKFLLAVPFTFFLILFVLNPSYFNPLIESKEGLVILFIILLIFVLYIYIIRRIMKIKVWWYEERVSLS